MARMQRVKVVLTPAMVYALEVLAERSGLPLAAQARVTLRSALDRTIHSAEVQDRLMKGGAYVRSSQVWKEELVVASELLKAQDAGVLNAEK